MDGYSEAGGYGNSKTWRQMRSGQNKLTTEIRNHRNKVKERCESRSNIGRINAIHAWES